nr:MAG TPA: YtxH-like protein [Caudoviricetes sp.]
MENDVFIAILGLFGSAAGAFAGILVNTKLTNWRLEKIEEKLKMIDNHNETIIELDGRIRELEHDVRDLKGVKP